MYKHASINIIRRSDYVVYEPASPKPKSAPVLVFLMGNMPYLPASLSHEIYGAFYEHLAKSGWMVIHPDNGYISADVVHQNRDINHAPMYLADVVSRALYDQKEGWFRVRPGEVSLGGHSLGGLLAQLMLNKQLIKTSALLLIDSTDRGIVAPNAENRFDPGNLVLPKTWEKITGHVRVLHVRTAGNLYADYGLPGLPTGLKWVWADAEIRHMFVNVPNEQYRYAWVPDSNHFSICGTRSGIVNSAVDGLADLVTRSYPFKIKSIFSVDHVDYTLWDLCTRTMSGKDAGTALTVRPDWFDLLEPLGPVPELPDWINITGHPMISFDGPGEQTFIIANFGPREIPIHLVSVRGRDADSFSIDGDVKLNTPVKLKYTPTRRGVHIGWIEVEFDNECVSMRDVYGVNV